MSQYITYNFSGVEKKWQSTWKQNNTDIFVNTSDKKYYLLEMFLYPSGNIHMGHIRNYTIGDAAARYKKMQGYNVLHPMGWDAFGLPAENAARQNNVSPKHWTYDNIDNMRTQLKKCGFSYDWTREFATCDIQYYKHQQQLFIYMYEHGLIYRRKEFVNWDPVDQCVLANEQVIDGKGWRSGAPVEQKKLDQWFLKITAYGSELLQDLSKLDDWPQKVKSMQYNWIGESTGVLIEFYNNDISLKAFSTRPETVFGVSFIAISSQHDCTIKLALQNKKIADCINNVNFNNNTEKQGIYTGIMLKNKLLDKEIPLYVANFVLDEYGTGVVMGVPGHDQRDYDFAVKYNLPIIHVFLPELIDTTCNNVCYEGSGKILDEIPYIAGMYTDVAKKQIIKIIEDNNVGEAHKVYKLRDWCISRQRCWGCPIPIIYCDKCGIVVNKQLPVSFPDSTFEEYENATKILEDWKHTKCPKCNNNATKELDTMDTFVDSSWYFFRFCSQPENQAFTKSEVDKYLPVDCYIGGVEHAILHLLYARFFTKALRDIGLCNIDEPFKKLITQGMICHHTYSDNKGKYLYPNEVRENNGQYYDKIGNIVHVGRSEKMSKSKKNVVDPDEIITAYGADSLRLFVVSDSPIDKDIDWSETGIDGCYSFINKFYRLFVSTNALNLPLQFHYAQDSILSTNIAIYANDILQIVQNMYEKHEYNKIIAQIRMLTTKIHETINSDSEDISELGFAIKVLIFIMFPIAPHVAEEAWYIMGNNSSITSLTWPSILKTNRHIKNINITVQVDGKTRAIITVDQKLNENEMVILAKNSVNNFIKSEIQRTIVVTNKLVNFVTNK